MEVRLHGDKAPEKAQASGNVARRCLGDLTEGKVVAFPRVDDGPCG
jgi:hypothetical protein